MRSRFLLLFAVVFLAAGFSMAQDKAEGADNPGKTGAKKSIADTLLKTAKKEGVDAAAAEYRRLRNEETEKYDFSEGELNRLGFLLLQAERPKDAIEIFKLNVEIFPKSTKAYESLGEGYLSDGQMGMGLVTYKKALELDPDNENALMIVGRLEKAGITGGTVLAKPEDETDEDKAASAKAVALLKQQGRLYDSYVGKYEFLNSHMVISKKGDKLFIQFGPAAKQELEPVSDTEFSISPIDSVIFKVESDGTVSGATLKHHVHKIFARKVG